jgi:RNA polymerase sigma factor (sigma-70 family)
VHDDASHACSPDGPLLGLGVRRYRGRVPTPNVTTAREGTGAKNTSRRYNLIVSERSNERLADLATTTPNVSRRQARASHGSAVDNTETKRQRRRREAHATAAQAPDATGDALGQFFRQASRHPLLTAAEEVDLAKRIERGDLEAKERMINSNLRLVISQARRFQGQGLPMGDLVQEGMLGLIRAVEKFDWRKGFKFSTYAVLWIKQSIQRGLANSGSTIRIPVHIGQRERKVKKAERELAVKLGHDPTDAEIAALTELPEEQVREALELTKHLASLDQTISEDSETPLGDLLPSEGPQPEDEVVDALANARVREVVGRLPHDERDLVTLRFGLAGDEPATLREAGTKLGISAERTRRLEEQALGRLAQSGELEELRQAA